MILERAVFKTKKNYQTWNNDWGSSSICKNNKIVVKVKKLLLLYYLIWFRC